jgi:DNA-binding CsgD family transcriptional regulator
MAGSDPKLQLVELAYDLETEADDWLERLGASLRASVPEAVSCYTFEIDRVDGRMSLGAHWAEDPEVAALLRQTFAEAPNELLDLFYSKPMLAKTTGEVLLEAGVPFESTLLPATYSALGIADVFAIAAIGPMGRGAVLGMCLSDPRGPGERARVEWSHVAAHVAASTRLRTQLAGDRALDRATAILHPNGKLEHLEPSASGVGELLRTAVERIEHARGDARSTPEALELWQGLVDGRWSLVDHFEDGRRYYIAIRNPPEAASTRALSRREAQVVAYVASGVGTKATAYALGLEIVTVRGYLHSAMAKLGVQSRAELIGLRTALLPPGVDAANNS